MNKSLLKIFSINVETVARGTVTLSVSFVAVQYLLAKWSGCKKNWKMNQSYKSKIELIRKNLSIE